MGRIGNFNIGKVIDKGGFGAVHEAADLFGLPAVAKVALPSREKYLDREAEVYKHLNGHFGFARVYLDAKQAGRRVLVLERLGVDLERLRLKRGTLSVKSVLMIGIRVLNRLQVLHALGFLHQDIKPQNVMTGGGARAAGREAQEVVLIDFGLAERFVDARGNHVRPGASGTGGTPLFAPVAFHRGLRQSRRSDVEGLAYTLVYLFRGYLPWSGRSEAAMLDMKLRMTPAQIFAGLPTEMAQFFAELRNVAYCERPPYERFRTMFVHALWRRGFRDDKIYDWS